ncbi:MAG TPA: purine-nucleoside phosphorylase [Candidatus Onthocola gallistercoris]|uniref:Purine nucleoside phosphorylase n=1 Tax=Candidatus Onthocola gallistercoris TaxID=2840876 RepID=A0A9D1HHK5_9FIRM|nr:purine-nucleoside phosphorylase [Candidatus Onthocola gallistercoris]
MEIYEKLAMCYDNIRSRTNFVPKLALVLGSGLGDFAETIRICETIDYSSIEGFPVSTVAGHKGRFVFGYVENVPVVIMQGRVHYYEGYDMADVVLPIRLMYMLGAKTLILTNAAGGIAPSLCPGDLMLITDQISSFVPSPLRGANMEQLGPRFPDMSCIYDKSLGQILEKTAAALDMPLKKGIYLQMGGPNYESPAEVRMCKTLGADAVGMSTACEAVAANHMGMKICGISCISNMASGISEKPLSHEEVQEMADQTAPRFKRFLYDSIVAIGESEGLI